MRKHQIKIIILTIAFLAVLGVIAFVLLRNYEESTYEKRGSLLIEKIETYRLIEKKLPNNLQELGFEEPMNDGPYYEKTDSVNYKVYFNVGFDNTITYYSQAKEWKDEP